MGGRKGDELLPPKGAEAYAKLQVLAEFAGAEQCHSGFIRQVNPAFLLYPSLSRSMPAYHLRDAIATLQSA